MTLVPTTRSARAIAFVWAVACVSVLLFAFVNRDIRGTDIVVLILLAVLCFPVSLALSAILTGVFYVLLEFWGMEVPGGIRFNASIWVLFVVAGYWQWSLMVPRQFKEGRQCHRTTRSSGP